MLTSSMERCYMSRHVKLLVAVLLLAGTALAAPWADRDRDHRKHYRVPEPGSTALLSLTGVTLAGAFLVRRRFSGNAAR